jgi:hypothetical protein
MYLTLYGESPSIIQDIFTITFEITLLVNLLRKKAIIASFFTFVAILTSFSFGNTIGLIQF